VPSAKISHVTIDRLEGAAGEDLLKDARLVIVAGVASPENSVPLLKEYVQQGGNLVIAAGGFFDAEAWNEAAWKDGRGILPAPFVHPFTVGQLPEEAAGPLQPFQLDYNSLRNHPYFLLEGVSSEEQADLYRLPYFFKAVVVEVSDEVKKTMVDAVAKEIAERRENLAKIDRELAELQEKQQQRKDKLTPEEQVRQTDLRTQRLRLKASWLGWSPPEPSDEDKRPVEEVAAGMKPTVLARYTNGLPFMVERRLGRGRVLLVSTGVYSSWNTLSLTNTMLIYDRILRGMLQETLPERNLSSQRRLVFPILPAEQRASFTLAGPEGAERPLGVDAIGGDRWGLRLGELTERGHYFITAIRPKDFRQQQDSPQQSLQPKLWVAPLAVNGPSEESRLYSAEEARQRQDRGQADSLQAAQAFSLEGPQQTRLRDTGLWRWFLLAVFVCLLLEMTILARPSLGGERTA